MYFVCMYKYILSIISVMVTIVDTIPTEGNIFCNSLALIFCGRVVGWLGGPEIEQKVENRDPISQFSLPSASYKTICLTFLNFFLLKSHKSQFFNSSCNFFWRMGKSGVFNSKTYVSEVTSSKEVIKSLSLQLFLQYQGTKRDLVSIHYFLRI